MAPVKNKIAIGMPGILDDAVLRHLVRSACYAWLNQLLEEVRSRESVLADLAQTFEQDVSEHGVPVFSPVDYRLIASARHQIPGRGLQHLTKVSVALFRVNGDRSEEHTSELQ